MPRNSSNQRKVVYETWIELEETGIYHMVQNTEKTRDEQIIKDQMCRSLEGIKMST